LMIFAALLLFSDSFSIYINPGHLSSQYVYISLCNT